MDLRMLGPLQVVGDDGIALDLGAPKQRAVLAVLLLDAGRVVHTDAIIAAVWGDDAPPSVAASLQAYLSNLRRLLRGGATIERRAPGYVLELPGATVDRAAFLTAAADARDATEDADWPGTAEAARRGLALWRGPLLADLADEPWVAGPAGALEEQRADTAELLVAGLLGTGRVPEAVTAARELHAAQPYRERAAWLSMLALHRAGRSAEALDVLAAHAARLDEELGLEAPPALRDLQVAILRRAPELDRWPGAPAPAAAGAAPEAAPAAPGIVGRRRELAVVRELVAEQRAGMRWLVLSGPAGIGKTRLAEETLARLGAGGARVVRTSCPDDDGTPPWWPVRQLLRLADGLDPDAVLTPPEDAGADAARYAVYTRLETVLAGIAAGPVAVLIDDAQWSDRTSLRWLRFLAESAPRLRIDVVVTVRDGVDSEDLERFLAAVARHPDMRQISVSPLGVGEVAELASRVSGDAIGGEEAETLTAQTGGNPFLVGEYARLPRDERSSGGVPVAVRSVLRRRLAAIDPEGLRVLRTAAVAGDDLDLGLLGAVTGLDRDELADLLDEAADRELVVPSATGGYRFSHGLLRDEVLAGLSLPRRQRLHARIADTLTGTGQHDLARRATHLVAALPLADPADAYRACAAAADAAEDRWQPETAAEWWAAATRAYALTADQTDAERDRLLIATVAALARAGKRQTVIAAVEAGLLEAVRHDRIASAGLLAATLLRTSGIWPWTSFTLDPGPLLTRLIGIEPLVRGDPGAHARVLAALAVGHYYDLDPEVPERLSRRAVEIAERLGDPDVLADALLGRILTICGKASQAAESVEVSRRLAALPHRLEQIDAVLIHDLLSLSLMTVGDVDGAEEHLRQGITGADAMHLPIVRVQLRWMETNIALWHGDLDRSERLAGIAQALHAQTELYVMSVFDLAAITRSWERGRLEEMVVDLSATPNVPLLDAALLLAAGRIDEGSVALTDALAHPVREFWTTLGEQTLAAHLIVERGLIAFAEPFLALLEPSRHLVAAFGQTGHVGVVALVMAQLAAMAGRLDDARALLVDAHAVAERGHGAPALLRCRLLQAELDGADAPTFARIAAEAGAAGMSLVAARASQLAAAAARRAPVPAA